MSYSVELVIPCLNEAHVLPQSVRKLHAFMSREMAGYEWSIVIADNGSVDGTLAVAERLSVELPAVRCVRLEQRGRGRALRRVWTESRADIVAFTDADLSINIAQLPALVYAVARSDCDIAVGSRFLPGSRVTGRPWQRTITSWGYSLLFRIMFQTAFRDAQCGFKALSRVVADDLVPLVADNGWFFDSELLILAEKCGYRIAELPVTLSDDPDSRVRILRTALANVLGLCRLKFGGVSRVRRQLHKRQL